MSEDIINEVYSELTRVTSFKLPIDDLRFALYEYGEEVTKTIIHQEIQNLIVKALREDPTSNHEFDLNLIEDSDFKHLKKFIIHSRREELKQVKIVISGKKYDISELKSTYYGQLILKDISSIGKRRMLTLDEYNQVKEKFLTVNLELPEVIKPTVTEELFAEIFGEENNE